ncbi:MAG: sulfotransferase family 2 domain-containing protein [Bacteroidota bacterium]
MINCENIELISIHIPKTAGTSFRNSLESVYGKRRVGRLDIEDLYGIKLNNKTISKAHLPRKLKVLHGHFTYLDLVRRYKFDKRAHIITWLRDPVKRVISNYFYLVKILELELKEQKKGLDITRKVVKSLDEFASLEINKNRMSKFLEGIDLKKFFFIGFVEDYQSDINILKQKLGWKNLHRYQSNQTSSQKIIINEHKTIKIIEENNAADIELYNKALDLKNASLFS